MIHRKEDGQQETFRVVTLTDATGQETVYRFRDTGHGHKYLGDGEPSEKAQFSDTTLAVTTSAYLLPRIYVILPVSPTMINYLEEVPWGNLWRWGVSSLLFFFVFVFLLILATSVGTLNDGTINPILQLVIIVSSIIIGAIVVWSDEIPWPGDP